MSDFKLNLERKHLFLIIFNTYWDLTLISFSFLCTFSSQDDDSILSDSVFGESSLILMLEMVQKIKKLMRNKNTLIYL